MHFRLILAFSSLLLFSTCTKDVNPRQEVFEQLAREVREPGCSSPLSYEQWQALLQASDTSLMKTPEDIVIALRTIRDIYAANNDLRGTFPLIYGDVTNRVAQFTLSEECRNPTYLRKMTVIFANKYLFNHYNHLMGLPVERHWKHYFKQADLCGINKLRVGLGGIAAHIVVDLARSVGDMDSKNAQFYEYMYLGEKMVLAVPELNEHLLAFYGIDAAYFLSGFFLGEMIDPAMGEGTTTKIVFQTLRWEAWTGGMLLQGPNPQQIDRALFTSWHNKELMLDHMAARGLMDR